MMDQKRESDALLQNDTIEPAQFFAPQLEKAAQGERALLTAILEDALAMIQNDARPAARRSDSKKKEAEIAREWIFSDDWESFFSFNNICSILGLNANCIRRKIVRMQFAQGGKKRRRNKRRCFRR